ncbi:MAG: hypothetical protein JWN44_3559 [Myxococcales bacterium]|nr:hypothetical protein [Myxococcales bacterium]
MRLPLAIATLVSLVLSATAARAQSDFVGVRAMGMGEAQRATASGASGPLLNPAGMALARQYVIEGMYGIKVETVGHNANVSIVDSITSRVAAGLFYTYVYESPRLGFNWAGGNVESAQLTRTGHAAGLSLAVPLGERFIIGATAKYVHFDTTAPLASGSVPDHLTLDTVNGITFDVGIIVRLGDKFNIGVIGYNLWDHGSRETPLSLGIGLAFVPIPVLSINFDTVINFTGFQNYKMDAMTGKVTLEQRTTARLGPGIEWLAANKVPLRVGVVYDSGLPATFLTMGLGYMSSSFGVDLTYRTKVQGGLENFLMLGIRIFID